MFLFVYLGEFSLFYLSCFGLGYLFKGFSIAHQSGKRSKLCRSGCLWHPRMRLRYRVRQINNILIILSTLCHALCPPIC